MTFSRVVLVVLVTLLFAALPRASAATITIDSSSSVRFLDSGNVSTDFSAPFTAANFTSAQTGPNAFVLTSTPSYVSSLVDGPGAVWIGTNPNAGTSTGDTALYAISFNLPGTVSSASLNLYYAVDNELGLSNPGIYINGTALPSSTGIPCVLCFTSFDQENHYTDASIGSLLVSGTNWLYFDAVNQGAPAGLIFSANITTGTVGAVPEPSSILLLGTGLLGVGITVLRRWSW
ncbi:MAG TPA: PEP-CTERM sorting domain-containing protein [Bryobacteraceae bacterium]|nr:PEP-CTERM sorting domain-containing protein [Bryobacteraceae bacterium]